MNSLPLPRVLSVTVSAAVLPLVLDWPFKHFTNPRIVTVSKRGQGPGHVSSHARLPDETPASEVLVSILRRRPRPILSVHDFQEILARLSDRRMRSRKTDLSKQYQGPNRCRPLGPVDVFSGTPISFRVLFSQIFSYRGPRRDLLSCLHHFVVRVRLAENVLESPVSNGGTLAVHQPLNSLLLLRNFDNGCQLVNLR